MVKDTRSAVAGLRTFAGRCLAWALDTVRPVLVWADDLAHVVEAVVMVVGRAVQGAILPRPAADAEPDYRGALAAARQAGSVAGHLLEETDAALALAQSEAAVLRDQLADALAALVAERDGAGEVLAGTTAALAAAVADGQRAAAERDWLRGVVAEAVAAMEATAADLGRERTARAIDRERAEDRYAGAMAAAEFAAAGIREVNRVVEQENDLLRARLAAVETDLVNLAPHAPTLAPAPVKPTRRSARKPKAAAAPVADAPAVDLSGARPLALKDIAHDRHGGRHASRESNYALAMKWGFVTDTKLATRLTADEKAALIERHKRDGIEPAERCVDLSCIMPKRLAPGTFAAVGRQVHIDGTDAVLLRRDTDGREERIPVRQWLTLKSRHPACEVRQDKPGSPLAFVAPGASAISVGTIDAIVMPLADKPECYRPFGWADAKHTATFATGTGKHKLTLTGAVWTHVREYLAAEGATGPTDAPTVTAAGLRARGGIGREADRRTLMIGVRSHGIDWIPTDPTARPVIDSDDSQSEVDTVLESAAEPVAVGGAA